MSDERKPYTRADYGQSEHRHHPGRVLGPFESIIDNRRLDATVEGAERARAEGFAAGVEAAAQKAFALLCAVRGWHDSEVVACDVRAAIRGLKP